MTRIDTGMFWLFMVFGWLAALTGVFALNVAPVLLGLGLVLAAMFYRQVVLGRKEMQEGLELLRGTILAQNPNRGEDEPPIPQTSTPIHKTVEKS
jgi:hypothetical protein